MYNEMMGMGEKPPKNYIYKENKEKFPVWFPPIPPSIKLEADCFPGRKKPETSRTCPSWGGNTEIKEIKGRARYGSIEVGNKIFYIGMFKIFNKSGLEFRLGYKNNREGEDLEKLTTR